MCLACCSAGQCGRELITFQTGGERVGCLACCAYGLCWVVARPSMPGPSLFAPPGSSREELKIVKTRPSPLPPSPRAVSYTSSQALYGVCGMNVNYMGLLPPEDHHQFSTAILRLHGHGLQQLQPDKHLFNPGHL